MELFEMSAWEAREKVRSGEIKAVELTESVLARIDAVEERVRAYVTLTPEAALEAAREADARLARGEEPGRAGGLPMAVKDALCTRGIRTTCSSRMLKDYLPVYDATVVERLKGEGLAMAGKANMDEFAMGSSTESSCFQVTRNPWDLDRVPGGSSGGSAAAVAAGEALWALGSDTGGSIRQPASFCGLVGMKPTYGLVSRYGLVALASSLDQVGSITRDVRDCALLLSLLAGHDPRDSTSLKAEVPDYPAALQGGVRGMRFGVPVELMGDGLAPGVRARFEEALQLLEGLGAVVEEASLPSLPYALAAFCVIAAAEASSNLARFDGVRYGFRAEGGEEVMEMYSRTRSQGFGPEVKRRIILGTHVLSAGYYEAYYGQAQKVRTLIIRDFERAFSRFDLLLTPTAPTVAFRVGAKAGDPLSMHLSDACTVPVNLAGIPALSLPCGLDAGMPVGLQMMGRVLGEADLLRAAYAFEQALGQRFQAPLDGKGAGA